jgi:3-hydroxy-9,10-secoandrosta-1,3,5(10)-triene-9,17-dione monooxygenase reductase component
MSVDSRILRQTVGQFVTGVAVIAMEIEGNIRAMTANSFTSLSLDPPLVLFCAGKTTKTGELVHRAKGFSVNILRQDQQALSAYFAARWEERVPPPFRFVPWEEGAPRLEGSSAAIGCTMHAIHEGGDHWIVVGRVLALHQGIEPRTPLAFYAGRYARLEKLDVAAPDVQSGITPVLVYHDAWEMG